MTKHSKEWNEVQARIDAEKLIEDFYFVWAESTIEKLLELNYTIIAPNGTHLRLKLPEGVTE